MQFNKSNLLEFLEVVDKELKKEIELIAVGGTALTLLDVKASTIDIDFNLEKEDYKEFESTLQSIPHGFTIDLFKDGLIFSQQLPDDYLEKCIDLKAKEFKKIKLKVLNPIDIIASKIGRLNERDIQDIKDCIKKFKIKKEELRERAKKVEYVGHEETYKSNLEYVLRNLFV